MAKRKTPYMPGRRKFNASTNKRWARRPSVPPAQSSAEWALVSTSEIIQCRDFVLVASREWAVDPETHRHPRRERGSVLGPILYFVKISGSSLEFRTSGNHYWMKVAALQVSQESGWAEGGRMDECGPRVWLLLVI